MVYPLAFVSRDKFPAANAVVNMGGQLGGAATPRIVGTLLDSLGWDYVFGFMAAISCLTFVLVLTISEPLKVRERLILFSACPPGAHAAVRARRRAGTDS